MTGLDLPAMVMDPPNQFPLTQTLLAEITGFVNTDGVRSGTLGEDGLLTCLLLELTIKRQLFSTETW